MQASFLLRHCNSGTLLLLLTLIVLFVFPLLPALWMPQLYPLGFSAIFILSAFAIKGARRFHLWTAVSLTAILIIAVVAELEWVHVVSRSLQVGYFILLVIAMVREIAKSWEVDEYVIVNAITAFFLLGIAFSLVVTILGSLVPGSYNIDIVPLTHPLRYHSIRQVIYYTFITYTTTGYGDVLPVSDAARSLAILIASCGQLYIAIILAMLVGKFSSTTK
jgi:hypothetical protein